MTAPVYPSSLPCWHTTPQTIQPKSGVIQSEMESGAVRIRRTRTMLSSIIQAETLMGLDQLVLFDAFWQFDALCGEQPVLMPLMGVDGVVADRIVRMLPDPSYEPQSGTLYKVTLKLMTVVHTGYSADAYQYLAKDGGNVVNLEYTSTLFSNPLHNFIESTLPARRVL